MNDTIDLDRFRQARRPRGNVTVKPTPPDRGDVVWLDHNPQAGHEQAGHRPALVLSPKKYNAAAARMLCCQVATKVKGNPFEVPLVGTKGLEGVVPSIRARVRKKIEYLSPFPDIADHDRPGCSGV